MPKARRANRVKMRVLKTIRLKCGRVEHPKGITIEVDPEKPYARKWLKEGKIEACVQ